MAAERVRERPPQYTDAWAIPGRNITSSAGRENNRVLRFAVVLLLAGQQGQAQKSCRKLNNKV